ncbi:MAG: hypothetical protein GY749_15995 [Desulfobacteraceae bacterium]|nr:hypothetical protein [Desulfobacteraceae bacterium]
MKPVYFPFTYVSEPVAEALASCFKNTIVYVPSEVVPESMQAWQKNSILDIRTPVISDKERLDAVVKDYKNWADIHKESGMAFLKTKKNTIPFFDDTYTSQIRSAIKQTPETEKTDPVFNARLFLHIAQEFDMQNWELNYDLNLFENMEQKLMKELKGDDSEQNIKSKTSGYSDHGEYMTSERTEAWLHLMKHDHEKSGLFITDSISVFEHLSDKAPGAEIALSFDSVPVCRNTETNELGYWYDNLIQQLDILLKNTWPVSMEQVVPVNTECDRKVSLKFCIIPGQTPDEFFNQCVEHKTDLIEKNDYSGIRNTLIGLMELQ